MRPQAAARVGGLLALVAAGPALAHWAPGVLTPLRAFILALGACFVAMALSLNMVSGHAGMPSLGHGALLAVGAISSGLVTGRWYLPFGVGLLVAAAVTAALALVLGAATVRLGPTAFALVTLIAGLITEQSLFRWRWLTEGSALLVLPRPQVGSFVFDSSGEYLAITVAAAALAWYVDGQVARSPFGRGMHLVREDEPSAQAVGIDPVRSRLTAFVLAGALAGVGGAVFGHLVVTVSADTFRYSAISLPLLSLVIIGGAGSRAGVAGVSVAYAVMPRILSALRGWDAIVAALLFIFSVARNPGGLAASVRRTRRSRLALPQGRSSLFDGAAPLATQVAGNHEREEDLVLVVSGVDVHRGETPVVRGVSLEVARGRVVAVVGPNGAGKTTLLDAVSGFIPCTAGRIGVGTTDVTARAAHGRRTLGVGRTFQRGSLPSDMPVREALLVAGDPHRGHFAIADILGLPASRRHEKARGEWAEAALEGLGLGGLGEVPVGELSVGQQRLVELTAALASGQRLLLLDEPSAGLAPAAVQALAGHIGRLADAGVSIVLVEHDLALVRAVSDEVVAMSNGRVIGRGHPGEVLADPQVIAAWLGALPPP